MSPVPILALVATPGDAAVAGPLLALLGRTARVVSWHATPPAVRAEATAVLATSLELLDGRAEVPTAVWVRDRDELADAQGRGVVAALTDRTDLAEQGAFLVPADGIEVDRWPRVALLVRERHRERHGLPAQLVLEVDDSLSLDDAATAMALASVVVPGPHLAIALALGSPVVTLADDADRLGVRAGVEVEVADSRDGLDAAARSLVRDPLRAARLAAAGRRFAETRLDLGRPAAALGVLLGLCAPAADRSARVDQRLRELWTPATARVARRTHDALAGYGPAPALEPSS